MVRPKKTSSKKPQKGGIDFKKIKRKIGRKLPPPKTTTDTKISSKAIILPEQSVASEKAGLATSKKGLTLKELLQQTSHYNSKVRRDALMGIKDICTGYPLELKSHKYVVIHKLSERINDDDKMVREMLYQLFKTVVFPSYKEDNQAPLIRFMMAYIFKATAHLAVDVQLMAFKFIDLVVQHHPASFVLYAEKILQSYQNILQNNQFHLQDKIKLKTIISGLLHCLSLLPCKKTEDTSQKDVASRSLLHAFELDVHKESSALSVIIKNVKDLVGVLVNNFHEFLIRVHTSQQLDAQSFDCMLYILQSIDHAVVFLGYGVEISQRELQIPLSHKEVTVRDEAPSPVLLKKIWDRFPLKPLHHLSEKENERCFVLNIVITKIFLLLSERNFPPPILLEKFTAFIENALYEKIPGVRWYGKAHCVWHVISVVPFLPKLMYHVDSSWRSRLLQAFTEAFKNSVPGSSLKLAFLAAIEEMILPMDNILFLDATDPEVLGHKVSWIGELPSLLIQLGDEHPACSKAVLRLQLHMGQCAVLNSPIAQEYDKMQYSLQEFYSMFPDERIICYGPFMKLPRDCQELSVCCIYYFSCLDSRFLKSLASCCLCHELEPVILLRIIEVLHSSYKAGHIQIGDHISFFITLLSRFKVFPENLFPDNNDMKISNRGTFKSVISVICSCLLQIGDDALVFLILEKVTIDQISKQPPLDNICAMLRMLVVVDCSPSRLSEQSIIDLSSLLPRYLIDLDYCIPEAEDVPAASMCIQARRYYLVPCLFLFDRSDRLLNLVLDAMCSLILESNSELSCIRAIVSAISWMLKDAKLRRTLVSCEAKIEQILHNILLVQSMEGNKLTIEERHNIQCAYDRLKLVTSTLSGGVHT